MSTTYRLTDLALPHLLDSTDVSFCAKGLYILICYIQPESLTHLASLSGVSRAIVKRECNALKEEGWLSFDIMKSERTIITPTAPEGVQQQLVEWLDGIKDTWFPMGESIMKAMLDNAVAVPRCLDNCRPTHIANPASGYRLEFDRFYHSHGVAFEFQGIQHRRRTDLHKSDEEFENAQMRDLVKIGLSSRHSIEVVEITAADLRIDKIIAKIPARLPLLRIDRAGKFVRHLDRIGQEYIFWWKRNQSRKTRLDGGGA
jgi:hypothetical protein